jgi:hypothetical protein
MCHGFTYRPDDREEIEEESDPAFLNEEADADVELVTDGGDEDEE